MAFAETPACRWHALADQAALDRELASRVLMAADDALRSRGRFHVVLAGGNTPRGAYRKLRAADIDWAAWHVYFGDERCLPAADPARNSRMAQDAWLGHVGIPAAQVHAIPAELGAVRAAHAYADVLRALGDFDLVLLGLGEDGHTASLFPGHEWGAAPGAPDTLAILDAPKAPPERVSLSAARLSRARQVIFLISGEAKRRAVAGWRAGKNLPARAIAPAGGVDVMVDAALLSPLRG
jgi:6-phosphogluconolactonase